METDSSSSRNGVLQDFPIPAAMLTDVSVQSPRWRRLPASLGARHRAQSDLAAAATLIHESVLLLLLLLPVRPRCCLCVPRCRLCVPRCYRCVPRCLRCPSYRRCLLALPCAVSGCCRRSSHSWMDDGYSLADHATVPVSIS
ncbi:hypothetical protein STEG23_009867 [Scotinomys teguina]